METNQLRVLISPTAEGKLYAQALDFDIAADGKDIHGTLCEFARVVNVHVASSRQMGLEPFKCLDRAPKKYHDRWETAEDYKAELPDLSLVRADVPEFNARLAVA